MIKTIKEMVEMKEVKDIKEIKEIKIIKKARKIFFLFISGFLVFTTPLLSGCAGMNGTFDCNVKSGGRCASMDRINGMADSGAFNSGHYRSGNLIHTSKKSGYLLRPSNGAPSRSGESVQQIWIAPYEDDAGNYHEESGVYSVIKRSSWVDERASVIRDQMRNGG